MVKFPPTPSRVFGSGMVPKRSFQLKSNDCMTACQKITVISRVLDFAIDSNFLDDLDSNVWGQRRICGIKS